jgi:glucose-1-phosphate adenylyltransferase
MGVALDSLVSHGCIISGGRVVHSVLSPGLRVNSHCVVEYSVLSPNVVVGRNCRIRRAIIDQNLRLPESAEIGLDVEADARAGHFLTDSGLVIVHRNSPGVERVATGGTRSAEVEART